MATVTAPWWLLWMLGGLAACGFLAACWAIGDSIGRVLVWWHDRHSVAWLRWKLRDLRTRWKYRGDYGPECEHEGNLEKLPPPLPPERTWEQMTSHQLPIEPIDLDWPEVCGHSGEHGGNCGLIYRHAGPHRLVHLVTHLEQRPPWWEAEQRQAYAALGLEYPSGLLARVREAADLGTEH